MAPPLPLIVLLMIHGVSSDDWGVSYSPSHICALKDSTVIMRCTYTYPTGHQIKEVFWTKGPIQEGVELLDLSEDTEYSQRLQYLGDKQQNCNIRLSHVTLKDSHMYYFRFTTDKDKWIGNPGVTLTVTDLQVESPERVTEGDSVNLRCKSSCALTDRATFIWYRNSQPLTERRDRNNELLLQSVRREDSGRYSCAVDGHTHISPAVQLNVMYPPKNVSVLMSGSGVIVEGDSVTLNCINDSNPPALNFSWFKENETSAVGSGQSFSALQSGRFYCQAHNQHGSQRSDAVTVTVKELSSDYLLSGQKIGRALVRKASSTNVSCHLVHSLSAEAFRFFPDLHTEVSRSWGKPVSYRVYTAQTSHYSSIHIYKEHGYGEMPKVEETLASYLSPATASSLKAPALPSKPVKVTSSLVNKAYAAAGQAAACLHTMSIMQAYQAELLGDSEEGGGISADTVSELRRATDLSLRATKETAKSIGRSMAALVATERHLWLNLSDIKDKEKHVLLDAPVSTQGLFGDAVNSAVAKLQEASKQAAALQKLLPRRSFYEAAEREQPHSSRKSAEHRATQKQSVSSRAPPQKSRGHGGRPQGTVLPSLPPPVLQGAAVSGEHISQGPPGNVVASGCPPPLRRVLEQSVRSFPAGAPLQGDEPTTQQQHNPETSLERLVPLVESLTAWKLLSNVSRWVLQTVGKGYQIQF
ncbi:unnamed protein product [Leuciscus chuanchicus]